MTQNPNAEQHAKIEEVEREIGTLDAELDPLLPVVLKVKRLQAQRADAVKQLAALHEVTEQGKRLG